jgi:ankyrin repeat protein
MDLADLAAFKRFIVNGAPTDTPYTGNPHLQTATGWSMLHVAANLWLPSAVVWCMRHMTRKSVDDADSPGRATPLMLLCSPVCVDVDGAVEAVTVDAARRRVAAVDVLHVLLQGAANVLAQDNVGDTCLHRAVRAGYHDMVRRLCSLPEGTALAALCNNVGATALMLVAPLDHSMRECLHCAQPGRPKAGPMPIFPGFYGSAWPEREPVLLEGDKLMTPLGDKLCWHAHLGDVMYLVQSRGLLQYTDRTGRTVLMAAASAGQVETLKWILQAWATDPVLLNARDDRGRTAVHHAVLPFAPGTAETRLACLRLLLGTRCVHVALEDSEGLTPWDLAWGETCLVLRQHESVWTKLVGDDDVAGLRRLCEEHRGCGVAPARLCALAVDMGRPHVVAWVLDLMHVEDVLAAERKLEGSLLHAACAASLMVGADNRECVRLECLGVLLARLGPAGVARVITIVNKQCGPRGTTPMHRAAASGYMRIVRALLQLPGALPAVVDREGNTAADVGGTAASALLHPACEACAALRAAVPPSMEGSLRVEHRDLCPRQTDVCEVRSDAVSKTPGLAAALLTSYVACHTPNLVHHGMHVVRVVPRAGHADMLEALRRSHEHGWQPCIVKPVCTDAADSVVLLPRFPVTLRCGVTAALQDKDWVYVAQQMFQALDVLHATGIVHGHISADNVALPHGGIAAPAPRVVLQGFESVVGVGAAPVGVASLAAQGPLSFTDLQAFASMLRGAGVQKACEEACAAAKALAESGQTDVLRPFIGTGSRDGLPSPIVMVGVLTRLIAASNGTRLSPKDAWRALAVCTFGMRSAAEPVMPEEDALCHCCVSQAQLFARDCVPERDGALVHALLQEFLAAELCGRRVPVDNRLKGTACPVKFPCSGAPAQGRHCVTVEVMAPDEPVLCAKVPLAATALEHARLVREGNLLGLLQDSPASIVRAEAWLAPVPPCVWPHLVMKQASCDLQCLLDNPPLAQPSRGFFLALAANLFHTVQVLHEHVPAIVHRAISASSVFMYCVGPSFVPSSLAHEPGRLRSPFKLGSFGNAALITPWDSTLVPGIAHGDDAKAADVFAAACLLMRVACRTLCTDAEDFREKQYVVPLAVRSWCTTFRR